MENKSQVLFKCSRNLQGLYVVCKYCTLPCFVNKIINKNDNIKLNLRNKKS